MTPPIASLLLSLVYVFTLNFSGLAHGAEKRIPIRANQKLNAEQWSTIRQAQLQRYVEYFNSEVKNGEDFDRALLFNLKAKNREEMRPLLADLREAPILKRDKDTLLLIFKNDIKVHVQFPERGSNRATIDGVSWTFDPSASMAWQIESFVRRMGSESQKSALFNFVIPQADAANPRLAIAACTTKELCKWIGLTVGGAVVGSTFGNLGDGVYKGWCWANSKVWRPWESVGWCEDWKSRQDARAKAAAAEAAARQERNPDQGWVPKQFDCPDDGKTFSSYMKEIKGNEEKSNWFRFYAKIDKDQITSAYVFDDPNADVEKTDSASIKLIYNKNIPPKLESLQFKNLNYDKSNPADTEYITYYVSDDPTKIEPRYRDRVPKMAAFADAAQQWVNFCRNAAVVKRFDDSNPGSGVDLTPESVKTPAPDNAPAKTTN